MQAELSSPALAYLWDHQVSGKALFPGAAFFELAAAAAKTLLAADSAVLTSVSIPAPLVLPAPQNAAPAVMCKLDAASGSIEVLSAQRSVHLRATLSAVATAGSSGRLSNSEVLPAVSLRKELTHAAEQRAVSAEPAYLADIDDSEQHARDVFLSPAVLDCCLHLGALPAAAAGQLKVPAGIQAMLLPLAVAAQASSSSSIGYNATALQVLNGPAASVIDYSLLSPGGASACSISGLQAKPLTAQPQPAASVGEAAQPASSGMLYQVTWSVLQPAGQAGTALPAGSFAAALSTAAGDSAALCSTGIAAFQAAATEQQNSMALLTAAAQPQLSVLPSHGSSTASLLWGMLRSVALEQTAAVVSAADVDSLTAGKAAATSGAALLQLAAAGALAASDAYGMAARGGLSYSATLLPTAAPAAVVGGDAAGQLAAIQAAKGRVAVTGGMGSLGSVLASWAEDAELARELVLIGRTGRLAGADSAASLVALLGQSATAITLAMADMAGSEGSASVLAAEAGQQQPLAALFHSGGVLADAILAKQAPGGIRAVFAAKVAAAQRWRATMLVQPAAAEVLFSSVAALLGSGGQANYSAANAALDAMAVGLQQQVGGNFGGLCDAFASHWRMHSKGIKYFLIKPPCMLCPLPAICRACLRPASNGAPGRAAAWLHRTAPPCFGCSAWAWR